MSSDTPSTSSESWFPLSHLSHIPGFDLALLPSLRKQALSSNLPARILNQIEYYFSDDSFANSVHIRSLMDNQGWVDVFEIAKFPLIRTMTDDISFILSSMERSTTVEVQVQGCKLRKRHGWRKWMIPPTEELQGHRD